LINLNGEQCILAITYDISRRRELEHQLRQAQKMEAVGRLAGGVAHDFNNMLGVITGYTDLIRARFEKDEAARNQVDEIRKASDRAVSLTRQLLAFSRKQVLQPETLNLNERIRDLGKMLQRLMGDDIELIVRLGEPLDLVKADPGQIDQVIVNLAVNARDAMPCGGKFIIETSCVELNADNTPHQHRAKPGRYVLVKISDTGHGMDPETLSHIFEPFFTTKQPGKGTGLGLSTVHGIVNQSDGYIWVYSEPGRGSSFKIYLPAVAQAASVAPGQARVPALARGSGTILLAEDDAPMRALTRHLLEIQGYRVLEADDGDAAVSLAEAHCDEIHLLLTDVVMPRLSGPSLAERVRTLNRDIRIIYMSGYTDELLAHHGAMHSGITFLEKPFTQESLMRVVQKTLSGAHDSDRSAFAAHAG
jgi:nitrogen-specific signal transduction histidine kinase/ActR/RegA family two-component response regulator